LFGQLRQMQQPCGPFYAVIFLVLMFVTYVPQISATARAPVSS